MFEAISIPALISLALVLWCVYELGYNNGSHNSTAKTRQAAGLLLAAKQAAEEDAANCRFACELFKAAIEAQDERIRELTYCNEREIKRIEYLIASDLRVVDGSHA